MPQPHSATAHPSTAGQPRGKKEEDDLFRSKDKKKKQELLTGRRRTISKRR